MTPFSLFAQKADHAPSTDHQRTTEKETKVIPNPLMANSYFHIKVPDGEALKRVEVVDSTGERVNSTDITFSKMGLFLPRIKPGNYAMKIELTESTVIEKIVIY